MGGVILLFKFGLPANIDRTGTIRLALGEDEAEIKKGKTYDFWGRFWLSMILVGFLLQAALYILELCAC